MQRVLAIWLPNWPIQRQLAARPELRGQPLVLEAPGRRGQAVAACSAEAAAAGAELGMPTAEAIAILTQTNQAAPEGLSRVASGVSHWSGGPVEIESPEGAASLNQTRCRPFGALDSSTAYHQGLTALATRLRPSGATQPVRFEQQQIQNPVNGGAITPSIFAYDPTADRKALAQLAQWCHRYSPTAGFEEAEDPETLLLDATNLAPLYGSEELFVAQVTQGFRRLGLETRIALAATIGAAWALAHYGAEPLPIKATCPAGGLPETPLLSQPLSTGRAGGFYETAAALAPLPIVALRLDADLLETLANLGAERVGDLLSLPREQLRSRFGPQLLTRIDQALGAAREVFVAVDPPEEFVVEQLFEYPVSHRESLHHVVETLLARLAWMLAARSAGALRVACRFDCEGAPPTEIEVGLFQPTANPRHLLEIVDLEFERLRLRAPATAVTIRALRHAPLAERQQILFDGERNLDSSRPLAALVDRLSSRLGEAAVLRCRLQHDAQPERAYRKEPLVQNPPPPKGGARGGIKDASKRLLVRSKRASKNPSPNLSPEGRGIGKLAPLDRPLYLLRRPAPLETIAVVPDGPPVQFRRAGRRHTVARHWGPERIETGWWRGRAAWRDYYRVETAEGLRYWLYRRRHDGRWFLHGMFG